MAEKTRVLAKAKDHVVLSREEIEHERAASSATNALVTDLDGTVFVNQSLISLEKEVARSFRSKRSLFAPIAEELKRYDMHRTYNYGPIPRMAVEIIPEFYEGLPVSEVLLIAKEIVEKEGDMLYLFSRKLIEAFRAIPRDQRGPLIAITGSPMELAVPLCKPLGFDLVLGVRYHTRNGYYTGTRDEHTIHDKGGTLDIVAEKLKLELSKSIAVGDTASDIAMLDRVGCPFALNPNDDLIAYLRHHPRIIRVDDRQKCGIEIRRADRNGLFHEVRLSDVLPPYLQLTGLPGVSP